ncbi:competence ComEA-like helix-hairpin-helix protein [Salibacterium salarium]|uniref:S-layer homology domain-containing protein n=1 Tax=Salibacterium salarium TaxID=284579 RepID=UPI002787C7DF|nr:S-layer homology domain-containing protein [Salibacterium salarium]MDQ0299618.1 competence ComEA-like helix-hairpin-helix protein [Salibacterium salarium]
MKIGKYILSSVLAFSLTAPVTFADSHDFNDVSDDFWAGGEIEYLAEEGIISGYDDGTFKPNEPVKRSQAASMIVEAFDLQTEDRPAADFTDIDQDYFAYDVAATVQDENIIGGNDGRFMPNDALTRGQMAAVLNRASSDITNDGEHISFGDMSQGDSFYGDVQAIATSDITTGYSDGTFGPNDETTRAQFSVFLARALDPGTFVNDDEETEEGDDDVAYPAVNLDLHFLDVGQGDSILAEPNGGGGNILIDGGRQGSGEEIVDYLEEENIDSLEWVVATHPDADHIGGLIEVLEEVEVENVLDSGKEHTTETYQDYLEVIDEKDINFVEAEEGEYLETKAAEVQILNGYNESSDLNESSIVLHFTYGETTALFTGDATVENEAEVMEEYDVEADVLKVGHHGADTSTSAEFVEAVDPEMAILSYGDNSYGHPDADVVETLRNAGVDLYSTYQSGNIEVSLSHQGPNVPAAEPWIGDGEGDTDDNGSDESDGSSEDDESEEVSYPINVNTADYETLQEITGVGPTIAENIIDYREANGSFESIEELDNVSYIGPATIEEMRPDITLG